MPRIYAAITLLVATLFVLAPIWTSAHEVPAQLTASLYVKPDQGTLRLLIRVPLHGLMGSGMPKEGIGYLSLATIRPSLERTARQLEQAIDVYENGTRLEPARIAAARISLPFDTSFASYDEARALLAGPPLPVDTQVYWLQGNFDAQFDYPIRSDGSTFSIYPHLTNLAPEVTTSLGFVAPDHRVQSYVYVGDAGRLWLDPQWYRVVPIFGRSGFLEAIRTYELWLFLLCLAIPWKRGQPLSRSIAVLACAFIITGLVVAYGPDATGVWLLPVVKTALGALIAYAALENIISGRRTRRWQTALALGVVMGLGYSIAFRQLAQFGGSHQLISLLSFNLGAVLGTALVLTAVGLGLAALYKFLRREKLRAFVMSLLLLNVGWTVFLSRAIQLPTVQWPLLSPGNMANATSWMLVIVVAAGCLWVLSGLRAHRLGAGSENVRA
jgi:hypothetical protein